MAGARHGLTAQIRNQLQVLVTAAGNDPDADAATHRIIELLARIDKLTECTECGASDAFGGAPLCETCAGEATEEYLTFEEVCAAFEEDCPDSLFYRGGTQIDFVARAEAFNSYIDGLCRVGRISREQYHEMENPYGEPE